MESVSDLINRFGGAAKMAPEIDTDANTIRQWAARGSIPGRHWSVIVTAATRLEIDNVTLELLAGLAEKVRAA